MKMRKCLSAILALFLLISGCSRPNGVTGDGSEMNDTTSQEKETSSMTQTSADDIQRPQLMALDHLKTVKYVSDEWTDGTYLVYGEDKSGSPCYGILDQNGGFEILSGYKAFLPLADGNLFVTNDDAFVKDFRSTSQDSNRSSLCASGKIIDRDGDTLYEPGTGSPYQKMYIIDPETILVIAASSGFDGVEVFWGVLDHTGQWVRGLDDSGILAEKIKNYGLIEVESDGSWSYANTKKKLVSVAPDGSWIYDHRVLYASRGGAFDDKENASVIFYMETSYDHKKDTKCIEVLAYHAGSNDFIQLDVGPEKKESASIGSVKQVNNDQWIQFHSSYQTSTDRSETFTLFDKNGSVDQIDNYFATVDGIKYWYVKSGGILYSDAYPGGITYPKTVAEKVTKYLSIYDTNAVMLVEGADGLRYLAIGDMKGNLVREPFRPTAFCYPSDVDGRYIAYHNDEQGTVYIYDISSVGTESRAVVDINEETDDLILLGNDLIAVEIEEGEMIQIYTFDGKRIA